MSSADLKDVSGGLDGLAGTIAKLSAVTVMMMITCGVLWFMRSDGLAVVKGFRDDHKRDVEHLSGQFERALDKFEKLTVTQQDRFERILEAERVSDRTRNDELKAAIMKFGVAVDALADVVRRKQSELER